jgi:predicted O-linked N-acetylglucosamine transferase (SPINDLY family)
MQLQLSGDTNRAEDLYRSILQTAPSHAAANYCLGMLKVQLRRPIDGMPLLLAALDAHPEIPDYWLGYLEALLLSGHINEAAEALALGREHGLAGDAVEDFAARVDAARLDGARGAGARRPTTPAGPNSKSGATRAARRQLARTLRKEDNALLALLSEHRFTDALGKAQRLTERFPDHGLGWKILGALLWTEGRSDDALGAMRNSVRLLPGDAEAHSNLGTTLAALRRFDDGEPWLRRALAIDPNLAAAHYRLGMHYELQARYEESEASLRKATSLRSGALTVDDQQGYSNLMYVISHNPKYDADALFIEHRRVGDHLEADLRDTSRRHANVPDPERCLKVAFMSGDLRDHSVAMFLECLLPPLAQRPGLELCAYYNYSSEDAVTTRLRRHFKHWQAVPRLSDIAVAELVMNDGIDILIDLSGHTAENRLRTFARKPAPVQVSWLGYPGTTGLQAMDYYLADPCWLPPGRFDHLFTEKLVYLPDRWAYRAPECAPAVGPLPALASGVLTFGSFHRLSKINASTLNLWVALLRAVPDSRLLLAGLMDGQKERLIAGFAALGISTGRLTFHGRCAVDRYLELHNEVDIALDALPYSGATTTMHSLAMGVPTLTLAGSTSFGRACAGIMTQAGLAGFVASTAADFIRLGVHWSNHLGELGDIRRGMRTRLDAAPGGNPTLIAAHLEGALRGMWRRWCAALPPASFHSVAGSGS